MKKNRILFLILALVLAAGFIVTAQAAVTTAKSGPAVGKHVPKHYVLDRTTNIITDADTGKKLSDKGLNDLPVLYAGDTVEFRCSSGTEYFEFVDSEGESTTAAIPGADGKTRVKVLGTASFPYEDGAGVPLGIYKVVTKIEIVGNEMIQLNAGSFHTVFGPEHEAYGITVLKYAYGPRWCDITREFWFERNADHHQLPASQLAKAGYYTDEQSSTRAWADDSLANEYGGSAKKIVLTLRRPYVEGLFYSGVNFDPKTEGHRISSEYRIWQGEGWHGNYWEGWKDNQVEIVTSLAKTGGTYNPYPGYGHASYDDELLVRFKYTIGRTVTFDACGGTIDGYPSRIYEAEGRQFFNQDLQEGKVDKAFAAGKAYVPVRKGYFFEGWYEDAAYKKPVTSIKDTVNKYTGSSEKASERICRLYAKWTPIVSLKKCRLAVIPDQVRTGKQIKPALTLTYKGEALKKGRDYTVAFKNNRETGKATVTITGKNRFTGTKTGTFFIVPKAVKLASLQAGKKSLTVKWKKGAGIDGYEIEYGLKKNFSDAKTVTVAKAGTVSAVLKKLEAQKTYYVRIRAFKKAGGKKLVSEWSKALSAETK